MSRKPELRYGVEVTLMPCLNSRYGWFTTELLTTRCESWPMYHWPAVSVEPSRISTETFAPK